MGDPYFDFSEELSNSKKKKAARRGSSKGALEKLMNSPVLKSPKSRASQMSPEGGKGNNSNSPWDRFRSKISLKKEEKDDALAKMSDNQGATKKLSSSDHAVGYRRNSLGRSQRSGRSKSRTGVSNDSSKDIWISASDDQERSRSSPKAPEMLALPAPGDEYKEPSVRAKSPRSRNKKLKDSRENSASVLEIEKSQERIRRKGSKKHGFLTPNLRSKPFVEIEDPARFTDMGDDNASRRSKSSKRSSSVKKRRNEKPAESSELVPFGLPFGDDETTTSRNSRNSKKEPKSPRRKAKRISKIEIKGYENEISDLQNQVMQLTKEKYEEENDFSKQLQDFKRKALDAKLELQRSQLENREVRSELRDKTTALKEAELDILDLEKRLREKANEVFLLEDELETAHNALDERSRIHQNAEGVDVDEVSTGGIEEKLQNTLREKDGEIASLEKEIERLESGGDEKDGEESSEDIFALKRDLRARQMEAQAMNSKFEAAQERNVTLDDEVQHWKKQSLTMEDELAEVRTQLNYWMAKYEDVVGASDSAKAQLSTPTPRPAFGNAHSLQNLKQLDTFSSQRGSYALDGSDRSDGPAEGGIGGLWKKLTTPGGNQRSKPNGSSVGTKPLSNTLH